MLGQLTGPTAGGNKIPDLFSDAALIAAGIRFELALAEACATEGLISAAELEAINQAGNTIEPDIDAMIADVQNAGTLAIPLVAALKAKVRDTRPDTEKQIHLGSTSQDLADSVCALLSREAIEQLVNTARTVCNELASLAATHSSTPMIARTLTRQALPMTFGLKAALWLSELTSALKMLAQEVSRLCVQLGGASSTLAGLQGRGSQIRAHMARQLNLQDPGISWHTNRQQTVRLSVGLNLVCTALAKIAQDVALLGQDEIGELQEINPPGRGGSSAMPHKHNPTSSQQALAAVARVKAQTSGIVSAPTQEFERSIQGWQVELGVLAEQFVWTEDALLHVTRMVQRLEIDQHRMLHNLQTAGVGDDIGESEAIVNATITAYERSKP